MSHTRALRAPLFLSLGLCLLAPAVAAASEPKSKRVETEAEWVAFDAEAKTVTVKVKKPGRGVHAKKLKRNNPATFVVKPEGSVLTKTVVKINGVKAELGDIPVGKTVRVYWVPDEVSEHPGFAMLIDTTFSEEEWEARYGAVED